MAATKKKAKKPAAKKPATKKQAKKPAAKKPAKKSAAKKSAPTKKPAAKKPAAKKPSTAKPKAEPETRWVSSGADDDALTVAMNCERNRDWAGAMAAYRRAIDHGGGSVFGARMKLMQAAFYAEDDATVLAMADELDGKGLGATLPGGLSSIFRGRVYVTREDWASTADAARTAIERIAANGGEINNGPVHVSKAEPHFMLGLALMHLDPSKAGPHLEEATQLDPSHSEALERLAEVKRAANELEDEIVVRRKLVALTEHGDDYYNLACALALAGHANEALDALEISITRVPENAQLASKDDDLASLTSIGRFAELTG